MNNTRMLLDMIESTFNFERPLVWDEYYKRICNSQMVFYDDTNTCKTNFITIKPITHCEDSHVELLNILTPILRCYAEVYSLEYRYFDSPNIAMYITWTTDRLTMSVWRYAGMYYKVFDINMLDYMQSFDRQQCYEFLLPSI